MTPLTGRDRVVQVARNATSFRLLFACLIAGSLVGWVLSLAWQPLIYLGLVVGLLAWVGAVLSPTTAMYCPFCRKRVKLGATVCHHCGRTVAG